jgi:hypothetical protein
MFIGTRVVHCSLFCSETASLSLKLAMYQQYNLRNRSACKRVFFFANEIVCLCSHLDMEPLSQNLKNKCNMGKEQKFLLPLHF